jgi:uncharacterized iron-regulated membrane protein
MPSPVRRFLLALHRYVGLACAAFLIVAGLTGSILAFSADYDHWLHRSLWQVTPEASAMTEQELASRIAATMAARIEAIQLNGDRGSQVFVLSDGRSVFVNPYTGAILGVRSQPSSASALELVRQLHVRLLAGNAGQWIVDIASGIALFLVPTGLYLWWERKRLGIRWHAPARRITWDLHNVIGLYTSFTVVILAATGLLIAFETPLNWMARSAPWRPEAMPRSSPHGSQGSAPVLDVFMQAARRALPDSKIYQVQLPMRQRSPLQILMHGPALAGHSTVYLDRYTAHVLRVDDFRKLPRAYRAHVINQAIHMSTILGPSSEILLSVSSLMLVVLAVTGCMMWWQRSM